ncbi:MAG TPA: sensor N-terminal transmembrane domain-containing protein, partial [Sphingomonas sp.]|nr:sensor N-terminal transmembrane domain-containing protein [Sphingomonas sp.]
MAPATASRRSDAEGDGRDLTLKWSGRISLTARILALNIFALALLAGGFFYLDSYRTRILDNRSAQASREARLIAAAMVSTPPDRRGGLALRLARDTDTRIRL